MATFGGVVVRGIRSSQLSVSESSTLRPSGSLTTARLLGVSVGVDIVVPITARALMTFSSEGTCNPKRQEVTTPSFLRGVDLKCKGACDGRIVLRTSAMLLREVQAQRRVELAVRSMSAERSTSKFRTGCVMVVRTNS
jgi:hypothetical protein